jgi:hypothetical protein
MQWIFYVQARIARARILKDAVEKWANAILIIVQKAMSRNWTIMKSIAEASDVRILIETSAAIRLRDA